MNTVAFLLVCLLKYRTPPLIRDATCMYVCVVLLCKTSPETRIPPLIIQLIAT